MKCHVDSGFTVAHDGFVFDLDGDSTATVHRVTRIECEVDEGVFEIGFVQHDIAYISGNIDAKVYLRAHGFTQQVFNIGQQLTGSYRTETLRCATRKTSELR